MYAEKKAYSNRTGSQLKVQPTAIQVQLPKLKNRTGCIKADNYNYIVVTGNVSYRIIHELSISRSTKRTKESTGEWESEIVAALFDLAKVEKRDKNQ